MNPCAEVSTAVGPVVVKVGGSLLDDPAARSRFLDRLALAAGLGRRFVLVHGGGAAVDRHLSRIGADTERIDGIRVTPHPLMPEIAAVLAGEVATGLLADLRRRGVNAVSLRLGDDAGIETAPLAVPFDPGAVGTVTGGRADLFANLVATGRLPVVSSIGLLTDGTPVNVNADDAAAGLAGAIGAEALLLLTDVAGVLDGAGEVVRTIDEDTFDRLVGEGVVHGGMIPKIRGALAAAASCGRPVVIGHWADATVLSAPLDPGTLATVVRATTTENRPVASPSPLETPA